MEQMDLDRAPNTPYKYCAQLAHLDRCGVSEDRLVFDTLKDTQVVCVVQLQFFLSPNMHT